MAEAEIGARLPARQGTPRTARQSCLRGSVAPGTLAVDFRTPELGGRVPAALGHPSVLVCRDSPGRPCSRSALGSVVRGAGRLLAPGSQASCSPTRKEVREGPGGPGEGGGSWRWRQEDCGWGSRGQRAGPGEWGSPRMKPDAQQVSEGLRHHRRSSPVSHMMGTLKV